MQDLENRLRLAQIERGLEMKRATRERRRPKAGAGGALIAIALGVLLRRGW